MAISKGNRKRDARSAMFLAGGMTRVVSVIMVRAAPLCAGLAAYICNASLEFRELIFPTDTSRHLHHDEKG